MKKYFCMGWRSAEFWFKDCQFDFRLVIMLLMEDFTPHGCFFDYVQIFASNWKLTILSSSPLRAAEVISHRNPALMKYFDSRGTSVYDKMLCRIRDSSVSFARGTKGAGAMEKMDLSSWIFFIEASMFSAVLQNKWYCCLSDADFFTERLMALNNMHWRSWWIPFRVQWVHKVSSTF